jgi:hypothetical protein
MEDNIHNLFTQKSTEELKVNLRKENTLKEEFIKYCPHK